jgi:hypothetical protein
MVRGIFAPICAAAAVAVLLACPWPGSHVTLTYSRHPGHSLRDFAAGKLGIVLPSFRLYFQLIAFRHIAGAGMNQVEQSQAMAAFQGMYQERHNGGPSWDLPSERTPDWIYVWLDESERLRGRRKEVDTQSLSANYTYGANCAGDAFRVATFTLRDRKRLYGEKSPWFRHWLASQDAVFSQCGDPPNNPMPPLPEGAPLRVRQDHAYHAAAHAFYRGQHEEAIQKFRAIALDTTSQWRELAPYLVARTYTRWIQMNSSVAPQATAEIEKMLANPSLRNIHSGLRALRRRNQLVTDPEIVFSELASTLSRPRTDLSLTGDLYDFTVLYRAAERAEPTRALIREYQISSWLEVLRHPGPRTRQYAYDRWIATRAPQWLVAALGASLANEPGVAELLTAASDLPANHPARPTAAYHAARLLLDLGDADGADKWIDSLLAIPWLSSSDRNLVLNLKSRTAPDLASFLRLLPRRPLLINIGFDAWEWLEPELPDSAPKVLSLQDAIFLERHAPLDLLVRIALSFETPSQLAVELQRICLMRALILEDANHYIPLANALANQEPGYRAPLLAAVAKPTAAQQHEALLAFTIRQPEIRPYFLTGSKRQVPNGKIDDYRDNFWSVWKKPFTVERSGGAIWQDCRNSAKYDNYRFVSQAERATAAEESKRLEQSGSGTQFYGNFALAYEASHPKSAAAADILGQAIRVARYSNGDLDGGKLITRVWRLLQTKYAGSPAAKNWNHARINEPWDFYDSSRNNEDRNFFPGVKCLDAF